MILVDYSQTVISSVFANQLTGGAITEDLLRHVVLNMLRSYNHSYSSKYGKLVVCCDGKNSWRKQYFPYYKANRKKERDSSSIDWSSLFDLMTKIREELKEYSPFSVIHIDRLEGDDCIGALVLQYDDDSKNVTSMERHLVISSDKDFLQLQKNPFVDQYSPLKKEMIRPKGPDDYLKEHIIRGDTSDGIPNIFSDDDVFTVEGKRQTPVTKKKMNAWMDYLKDGKIDSRIITEETLRNFYRNRLLIDLDYCPKELKSLVHEEYEKESSKKVDEQLFMEYLIRNRLKSLVECIDEFFTVVN